MSIYLTQDNVKGHIQYEKSWYRWTVIESVITNNTNFRIYLLNKIVLAYFQSLFARSNCDTFWKNVGKMHEGGCVKE